MRGAIARRFGCCFRFDHSRLSKLYAAATYLDRRYRQFLSIAQQEAAKEYLQSECPIPTLTVSIDHQVVGISDSNVVGATTAVSNVVRINNESSISSLFASYYENEIDNRLDATVGMESPHPILAEFEMYERYPNLSPNDKYSPIDYWVQMEENGLTPILSSVALDVLSIPASSASVERLFSAAGRAKNYVRSSLGPTAVEQECIVRLNRMVLEDN